MVEIDLTQTSIVISSLIKLFDEEYKSVLMNLSLRCDYVLFIDVL